MASSLIHGSCYRINRLYIKSLHDLERKLNTKKQNNRLRKYTSKNAVVLLNKRNYQITKSCNFTIPFIPSRFRNHPPNLNLKIVRKPLCAH